MLFKLVLFLRTVNYFYLFLILRETTKNMRCNNKNFIKTNQNIKFFYINVVL